MNKRDDIEGICNCGRPVYRDQSIRHVCDPATEWGPWGVRCARCSRDISSPDEPKMPLPLPGRSVLEDQVADEAPAFYVVCAECWTTGGELEGTS
jgi:hypothetical protein